MKGIKNTLLAAATFLPAVAGAVAPPQGVWGLGMRPCSHFVELHEKFQRLDDKGPVTMEAMGVLAPYGHYAGIVTGYATRLQMERGLAKPPESRDTAMQRVYQECLGAPNARFIDAAVGALEGLFAGTGPAPSSATSDFVPGSPIPLQLGPQAKVLLRPLRCEVNGKLMYCVFQNASKLAVDGMQIRWKAISRDGVVVGQSALFGGRIDPGESARAQFSIEDGNDRAARIVVGQ